MIPREACQVRKKAALSGSGHARKSSRPFDDECTEFIINRLINISSLAFCEAILQATLAHGKSA